MRIEEDALVLETQTREIRIPLTYTFLEDEPITYYRRNPIMSIELKIKSKHLATEPGIIKKEERKLLHRIAELKALGKPSWKLEKKYASLYEHRRNIVRDEARATFLARAFLNGRKFSDVEDILKMSDAKKHKLFGYCLPRIEAMVNKYGQKQVSRRDIVSWFET